MNNMRHYLTLLETVEKDRTMLAFLLPWTEKGIDAYLYDDGKRISLNRVVVPPNLRGKGLGGDFMRALVQHADSLGRTVVLSPSTDFGGSSVNRLKDFYKRYGFVVNKGRNRDFEINYSMYRKPTSNTINESSIKKDVPLYGYHGTSSEFLDSIKKKGLSINPPERVYEYDHVIERRSNQMVDQMDWVKITPKSWNKALNDTIKFGKQTKIIEDKDLFNKAKQSCENLFGEEALVTERRQRDVFYRWDESNVWVAWGDTLYFKDDETAMMFRLNE